MQRLAERRRRSDRGHRRDQQQQRRDGARLGTIRRELGDRQLQLRVDRSLELVQRVKAGEVDAAIVLDPGDAPRALELGSLPLSWWGAPALAAAPTPLQPLPLVSRP